MFEALKAENVRKIKAYTVGENDGYVSFYPRFIQLEHTTFCNADCVMCNHFFLGNKGAKHLPEEIVRLLEPVFPHCQMMMLNGDGEPFLHPELPAFLERYTRYGIRLSTNTNLCGCSADRLCALAAYFDYLNVSCDGATKETFEAIRKNLRFPQFLENLRALRAALPHKRLHLDCVLMAHNLRELPQLVAFAAEYGFSSAQLNLMEPNPLIGNFADSILNYPQAASYYLSLARDRAQALRLPLQAPLYLIEKTDASALAAELEALDRLDAAAVFEQRYVRTRELKNSRSLGDDHLSVRAGEYTLSKAAVSAGRPCSWALERCYIDVEGNVSTCCFNVHHYMGNLREEGSFEAVWNGENYRRLRVEMAKGRLPVWCRDCRWFNGVCGKREKGADI